MNAPRPISGLREIAGAYDAILCDVWGVIHNGRQAFIPACGALARFRERGGRVILITNAPVPKAQVISYFEPLGVPEAAYDDCVSSGDATRAELMRWRDKRIYRMGVDASFERDAFLYRGLDLDFAAAEDSDVILCIGMRDQVNEHPEDYRGELARLAAMGLPMICANPDIQVRVGDRLIWCAGALAAIYEELGGEVIYPGKPHSIIYRFARERLAALPGLPATPRLLAIGDGPITDIKGANSQGIDSLYVGTGLARHEGGDFSRDAARLLAEAGVSATYSSESLAW